jgi:hypothetical protein
VKTQIRPRESSKSDCIESSGRPLGVRKIVVCPSFHRVNPTDEASHRLPSVAATTDAIASLDKPCFLE